MTTQPKRAEYFVAELVERFGFSERWIYEYLWASQNEYLGRKGYGRGYDGRWYIDARALRPHLKFWLETKPELLHEYYDIHINEVPITLREIKWWIYHGDEGKCFRLLHRIGDKSFVTLKRIITENSSHITGTEWYIRGFIAVNAYGLLKIMGASEIIKEFETSYGIDKAEDEANRFLQKDWLNDDWTQETINQVQRIDYIYEFDYLKYNALPIKRKINN